MMSRLLVFVATLCACDAKPSTPTDAALDAPTDDRCTDTCPAGKCANGRCKPVCPGPGGLGETCGSKGSICCGLTEICTTGGPLACTDACSPFDASCPPGFGCHVTGYVTIAYTDCREAGAGTQGTSCATSADCAPGFYCIGGTSPRCVRYCIVDDDAHGCDGGTSCHPLEFFDDKLYGLCF
jgi:hypothetical protein